MVMPIATRSLQSKVTSMVILEGLTGRKLMLAMEVELGATVVVMTMTMAPGTDLPGGGGARVLRGPGAGPPGARRGRKRWGAVR